MRIPKILPAYALGVICLVLATAAHADTVTLTLDSNYPADYAFYTWTDIYGVKQTEPVSPYLATLNGGGYNNQAVLVFCYDLNSPTDIGTAYPGSVQPVTSFNAQTQTEILESTYLINLLLDDGGLSAPLATKGAISTAIWEIMYPSSTTNGTLFPTDPAALPYESLAAAAVADGTWTDADANLYPTWAPGEEYADIQRFGDAPVPESSTLFLMGLGLLGLGLAGWRTRVSAS